MTENLEKVLRASLTGPHWEKIGIRPHHGINLPLSALHSKTSCGIGEFLDLLPLIDWCQKINMDLIQLLPLNDSGNDPSPYNTLSSCALNPIFLSLHALPFIDELPELKNALESMRQLTKSSRICYNEVKVQKLYWLRTYYACVGEKLLKMQEFAEFLKNNSWTIPYALFKVLKDILEQSLWQYWPEELQFLSKKNYENLTKRHWEEICFHLALQYLCFVQLSSVKNHAQQKGILLKGDVPILISPDSADVWFYPDFFDLTLAAGAPPDQYSKVQQYWGFPLQRWDMKKKTQYSWWKERLKTASQYFDLYRLDHIVGLFRVWAIPMGHPEMLGHYVPEDESLWIPQGKEFLEMLLASFTMLPIAEDLGKVPPSVKQLLHDLGIPGTKVMRWERIWNEEKKFLPYSQYSPISMTCVSTHDSETLALWWRDSKEEAKVFAAFKGWHYLPELSQEQRKEILTDSHHTPSLFHINLLQEYLALFPDLVWTNLEDERINIPGKLLPSNWTYRFRPSVEEITAHAALAHETREIVNGGQK